MDKQANKEIEDMTKGELAVYFGKKITEYRKAAKKSQSALADLMGVSKVTITNWEKGRSLPDIASGRQLAIYLNIPLYDFFDLSKGSLPNADEKRLLNQYRSLSESSQSMAYGILKAMVKEEMEARDRKIKEKYLILPLQSSPAAAGTGCFDNELPPTPYFVKHSRASDRADMIVRVSGRSMEPVYHDGDLVFVACADAATDEEDVVCVYSEGIIIKRQRNHMLYSLNQDYDFGDDHEYDEFHMIGRVLGILDATDQPDQEDKDFLFELFTKELAAFDREYNIY